MPTGCAFTTWLDLRLAACQSGHVRDALIERMPTAKDGSPRVRDARRDLLDLDERLRVVGRALGDEPILASHPVYQYLADAYGLSIQSLHLEPDQALRDEDWKEVDAMLKPRRAKWMLLGGPSPGRPRKQASASVASPPSCSIPRDNRLQRGISSR